MGNYDDFDLDIQTTKTGDGPTPHSVSEVTWAISSLISGSFLTSCTGDCLTTNCGTATGCSQSTCTCYCS